MLFFEEAVLGLSFGSDNLDHHCQSNAGDPLVRSKQPSVCSNNTLCDYQVRLDSEYDAAAADAAAATTTTTTTTTAKVSEDMFENLCVLGRGAFGKVYLVRQRTSDTLYAMKVLKKASLLVHANHVETERQILKEVQHPFIVKLHYAFQTRSELHMILEYAVGGELFRYLDQEGMFHESKAAFYAAELVLALDHLHSLGIVYRDLKPENCLLDREGHILLTDFGLSKVSLEGKTNTICGTAEYMAPEILAGLAYDYTVDWWSLGILIFDMLTGSPPFRGATRDKIIDNILTKKVIVPYYVHIDARDIIFRLLRKNPMLRLGSGPRGANDIRQHAFFRDIQWDLLSARGIQPPITPVVTNPASAENFDPAFTRQRLESSGVTLNENHGKTGAELDHFRGFSFVNTKVV